jgi:putative aldouronate transport system permease protein
MKKGDQFYKVFNNCFISIRKNYLLWLMVLPAVIEVFIFHYIPIYGIQLAFREYDFSTGGFGGKWVGFKYFTQFFNSYQFKNILWNTFFISISNILIGFPVPIILAILINQLRHQRIKGILQTTVYMPHFISTPVMVGLLIVLLAPNTGIISRFLNMIFGIGSLNLLGEPKAFVPLYVLSEVWQHAGWNSIVYLAVLSNVDLELYEACRVDGGGRWHIIRYVELPVLVPTMLILLILSLGNILSVGFEKVFLMQNSLNIRASEVIPTYVYKIGLLSAQFSYATAIGLFNTIINFTFLSIGNRIAKRLTGWSLW